ncbi:hypothetical protein [Streptomyces sp. NPDC088794]|uniref:effector-associated constant component EACC1 n=1 Tax=Streptomyces sp. NPDC088794 TaxID=3365902 RepID=UPI00382A2216
MADMDAQREHGFEVRLSDPSQQRSLRGWVERVPGVRVEQAARSPEPGEQGAADVLTILAGSGGVLAVAIRTLPEFIRSQRSSFTLTVKLADGTEYTLNAENLDELPPVIEKAIEKTPDA